MGLDFQRFGSGGGGGATSPKPLSFVYGDMSILDAYVTGITENSLGDYTFDLDYTKNRTAMSNGDFSFHDVITEWKDLGAEDYFLNVRIEVVNEPDNVSGTPYVAAFLRAGPPGRYTGAAGILALVFHNTGTDRSVRQRNSLGQDPSPDSTIGTPNDFTLQFRPQTGARGNMRMGFGIEAETTIDAGGRSAWSRSDILGGLSTANIEAGYDAAGGCFLGFCFQQRASQTGTGTMRLRLSYWFAPVR